LQREPLLARNDWQFHWTNCNYRDFAEFLGQLRSKKRKNIKRDRRLVQDAGIRFECRSGAELSPGELEFVYNCYQLTFLEHGNHPALNREFFARLVRDLPHSVLVVLALRGNESIAMSLCLVGGGRLYGRYWGCMETVPGLHFETCYYQGIEYCIAHGIAAFEPGAQGEHKISRGFIPVPTRSFHHVREPVFRRAIADYLQKERDWMENYRQQLEDLEPIRAPVAL
jgi:predicted N-acyltransferase